MMKEVRRTFEKCSNSPGPDGITGQMIDMADRDLMTHCLHLSWSNVWCTHIPQHWKLEHRLLLPKSDKDNYNESKAYRTISLTDIFGKRFEKIVSARLVSELESGGFDESQFAYLRSRSATQAVLSLVELVKSNVLAGNMVGVLFFDFADAFGSLNRVKLIGELIKSFGITGTLLKYLMGFLSQAICQDYGKRSRRRLDHF